MKSHLEIPEASARSWTRVLRANEAGFLSDVSHGKPSDVPVERPTATIGTFEYIEQKIRDAAVGTEFGTDFEWLCRFFLLTAPKYKGLFRHVWLWNDWPGRWGIDKGI